MDFKENQNIGTMEVLERHQFDEKALTDFMEKNVQDFVGPLSIEEFKGGQSNPTYLVKTKTQSYVLRRKPPGKLLKSAHAVDREYRVITALNNTDVPVPKTFALCEDTEVVGTAFYLMEFMDGRVLWDPSMEDSNTEEALGVYTSMNNTLAKLHSVDPIKVDLESFGRPGNYVGRQVSIWSKQYVDSETEEIVEMNKLTFIVSLIIVCSAAGMALNSAAGGIFVDTMTVGIFVYTSFKAPVADIDPRVTPSTPCSPAFA